MVNLHDCRWNTLSSDLMALSLKLESISFRLADGIIIVE